MTTTTLDPFLQRDFLAFEKHRQHDEEYNALRLSIRRKLKKIADRVKVLAKEQGVELSGKEGLHHPYTFNSYRVRDQRSYLCRSDKERKKLASFFGDALGKDAETHYIQTVLEVAIDNQVVEAALRVHSQAWWDGENLKKKVATPEGLAKWAAMLNALPKGFGLRLHDWKNVHWAGAAKLSELKDMFSYYTPGNHWLHVVRELPAEDALAMGRQAPDWVVQSLLALLPMYRFILWEPA
jgi:hypothetical protein